MCFILTLLFDIHMLSGIEWVCMNILVYSMYDLSFLNLVCVLYISRIQKKKKYFTIHSIFFCIEKLNIVLTHNLKLNIFLIVYTYVLMGIWNGLNGDLKKWKFNVIFSKKKKVQWNCHCKWNNQYNCLYIKWHIFLL